MSLENRIAVLEALLVRPQELPFKRLHPDAKLPHKSGDLEACYDFHCVEDDDFWPPIAGRNPYVRLNPGDSQIFQLGLACAIPEGRAMFLWDRSGMGAKRNIHRLAGVIDATFRGPWQVCLINHSRVSQVIEAGDKIVQGHLALVLPGNPTWADDLPESYRGEAGFGSTGR